MIRKILVAIDAASIDTVLSSAIDIARRHDATICAVHVVDPSRYFVAPLDHDCALLFDAMEKHGLATVAQIKDVLDGSACTGEAHMITLPVLGMTIGNAIASFAQESDVDLIVLGERKSGWWRLLDENVAMQVQRRSDKPIQIVSRGNAEDLNPYSGTRRIETSVAP
jgi:nucleotide-binding universal stress UspA family protein